MRFRTASRDGPSGQSNLRLIADVNNSTVGWIDYVLFQGKPSINMVEVQPSLRRNGYGSALVYQLQREFPSQEIDWGMLTGDGAKLFASIPKRFLPDSEYAVKRDQLNANKEKLARYSQLADSFHAIESPSDAQRNVYQSATGDWNDLHDMQWELEQYLASTPPGITLLVVSDCSQHEKKTSRPRIRA
ncbi:GNAT family N-acetyltransferase [Polaromonas sp. AER18D-145]|uniref:GNAT family N-acetyltransferase n=1 Tax=Polaromonas sp. AER18D-145 TaxID=1977060 RepID=UPI001141C29F|nr:GNAT family N-acetyltransferase [Polaromonas sp. AER18D-145]